MSTALLELETEDFAYAAQTMDADVAGPLAAATEGLLGSLLASGAMAGSDPAGVHWAAGYDGAASAALAAAQDAVNACYRLSAMFAQTARNYESADHASTAGARHAVAGLPDETVVSFANSTPSAAGGSASTPFGWAMIAHAVGYLWPDGHQDRLHAAAAAWRTSADALQERSDFAALAPVSLAVDRLPESEDMITVCNGMCDRLRSLSGVHRSLANACDEFAEHLDRVHAEVIDELFSLIEWTAGIESAGGLFAVFTLGASEAVAQVVEASRIAAAARRVAELIEAFIATARAAAESIPAVQRLAESISLGLEQLLGSRLVLAGVTTARALPGTAKTAKTLRTAEMAAEERLAASATTKGLIPLAPRVTLGGGFRAPRIFRNRHGLLTNGRYTVSSDKMLPHLRGSLAGRKSQFFQTVDADRAVLNAAAYADAHALWNGTKAKVFVENGPVGVGLKQANQRIGSTSTVLVQARYTDRLEASDDRYFRDLVCGRAQQTIQPDET